MCRGKVSKCLAHGTHNMRFSRTFGENGKKSFFWSLKPRLFSYSRRAGQFFG